MYDDYYMYYIGSLGNNRLLTSDLPTLSLAALAELRYSFVVDEAVMLLSGMARLFMPNGPLVHGSSERNNRESISFS